MGDKDMKVFALLATGLAWASIAVAAAPCVASEHMAEGAQTPTAQEAAVDCSKETWPNFSPSCIRNANSTVAVRIVTVTRR